MQFKPLFGEKLSRPFLIAGPCSAETEDQVMNIAHALKDSQVDVFRAGIWKPRTRPNSFEGVGVEGLAWLRRVKEETGMKVCTEVANKQHVYEALKYGVDVLWIGARTTVNPFSVQEIADAIEGVDIPVMVKNPINPDLALWMGAIERLYKAGLHRIAAIHRGFSFFGESKYRNVPRWQIPIDLMRRFPDLPIICDNSHICGRRDILSEVAQQAFDLNFDGLMTEVHNDPDQAWSDAKQQITPATYLNEVKDLVLREVGSSSPVYNENIDQLREQIDGLDHELLELLGKRMGVVEEIGKYKKRNNISILQPARWSDILDKSVKDGEKQGLSAEFIAKLFKAVHQESIAHQMEIMKQVEKEASMK